MQLYFLACVCSIHFEDSCFKIPLKCLQYGANGSRRVLKPDAPPSLNLSWNIQLSDQDKQRKTCSVKRKGKYEIENTESETGSICVNSRT